MTTITNGLRSGNFHQLKILYNGIMQDIIPLLGGGGSSGTMTATAPLSISNGVLSINTSTFCTAATAPLALLNGQLSIDLSNYSTTTQASAAITAAIAPYVLTTTLGTYSTTTQITTAIMTALQSYVTSSVHAVDMASKIDSLTVPANSILSWTGIGTSRELDINTANLTTAG